MPAQNVSTVRSQPFDVAVMFNAEHSRYSYGNDYWMYGGSGELAARLPHHFGIVLNATGEMYSGANNLNPFSKVMTTAGPRYSLPLGHMRSEVFVEGLFGGVHGFNSVFPYTTGALWSASAFAMQVGGGYNLHLNHTWAIRVVEVHYVRTDLPNGFTNRQQDLLVGAGIVWRPVDTSAR